MHAARSACYILIGIVLATGGITWRNWQLYAALVLAGIACEISERITVARCP